MPAPIPRLAPRLKSPEPHIRRERVSSSSVREAGYDPVTRTLDLKFARGGIYRYHDVPPAIHAGLLAAQSAGAFVNEQIRDRFRCHRIG